MDEHKDCIPRTEAQQLVRDVADSMRREFTAALTTVQVQIGSTEKVLGERIKSALKWGALVTALGQIVAALVALKLGAKAPSEISGAVRSLLGL